MHKDFIMSGFWPGPGRRNHGRPPNGSRTLRSMAWLETTRAETATVGLEARPSGAPPRAGAPLRRVAETYGLSLVAVATCTAIAIAVQPYALLEDEEMIY